MSTMFCFKLLVAAAIIRLVQAQPAQLREYIYVYVGEGGLYFSHPQTPAGIGDSTCSILFNFPLRSLESQARVSSIIDSYPPLISH